MTEGKEPGWVAPGLGPPPEQDAQRLPPGYGGPPWAGPPRYPAESPRTEGLAIAAVVLAAVSFFVPILPAIVALVLAAVAARRIREAPAGVLGGSGLVTAARVLAAIGLLVWVGLAALLVVVVTQVEEPTGKGTVTDAGLPSAREVGVDALEVGDCVNDETLPGEGRVVTVNLVHCGQPHDLEVFANATMPGGDFPGDQAVERFGDRSCVARFKEYVGIPFRDSKLDYYSYWPTEDSWNAGDRVVTCAAVDPHGGKLTGSVRGTRR
jgi:hypothetical protein